VRDHSANNKYTAVQHCFPVYGGGLEVHGVQGILQVGNMHIWLLHLLFYIFCFIVFIAYFQKNNDWIMRDIIIYILNLFFQFYIYYIRLGVQRLPEQRDVVGSHAVLSSHQSHAWYCGKRGVQVGTILYCIVM
jgi:hypothetical protein